jgi:hypothetical protein
VGDTGHAAARPGKLDRVGERSLLGLYHFNTGFSWSESGCPLCPMNPRAPSTPKADVQTHERRSSVPYHDLSAVSGEEPFRALMKRMTLVGAHRGFRNLF